MPRYSKEQAQTVITDNPNMDPAFREYWQAIAEGTLNNYYKKGLIYKRDAYSNDLPQKDVSGEHLENGQAKYKCQGNYVVGLSMELKAAIADEIITDQKTIEAIFDLFNEDIKFELGNPNNKLLLDKINSILNMAIDCIK